MNRGEGSWWKWRKQASETEENLRNETNKKHLALEEVVQLEKHLITTNKDDETTRKHIAAIRALLQEPKIEDFGPNIFETLFGKHPSPKPKRKKK